MSSADAGDWDFIELRECLPKGGAAADSVEFESYDSYQGDSSSDSGEDDEDQEGDFPVGDGKPALDPVSDCLRLHILPLLPPKTLQRLRSVSPEWNRWIVSPFLVLAHRRASAALTGLFFHSPANDPSFASFSADADCELADHTLSFHPEPVRVAASNGGLLCCRGRVTGRYYISNPALPSEWAPLPLPANRHGADVAVAIVFKERDALNFDEEFSVVCCFPIAGDGDGIFGVEKFSSKAWEWTASNAVIPAERIVPASGVGAAGTAYWRTTKQTVVAYELEPDTWREMWGPAAGAMGAQWELGEHGGGACCVVVDRWRVELAVLEGGDTWRAVGPVGERGLVGYGATPLRAQGREAVVWDGGRREVVAHEVGGGAGRTLADPTAPSYCADFVPYISSLVRVRRGCESSSNHNLTSGEAEFMHEKMD